MRRWVLAAALLVLGLGMAGPALAATAATPTPGALDPVIVYSGTAIVSGEAPTRSYPMTVTIDCSTGVCLVSAPVTDGTTTVELTGAAPLEVVGGRVSTTVAPSGDACAQTYVAGGPFELTASATSVQLNRSGAGTGQIACGSGSVQYSGYSLTLSAAYVSGSPCLLDNSCPTTTPTAGAVTVSSDPTGSSAVRRTISTPSTLSTLPTLVDAMRPANVIWATAVTIVLAILVALPTQLFDSAVEHGAVRIAAWRRRVRLPRAPTSPRMRLPAAITGWPLALVGVVIASLISCFAQPSFGFDLAGLRAFASTLLSFLLVVSAGWLVVILLARRRNPDVAATVRFAPATLLVVLGAVLFSRVTGFQPGIVFGLVAGVAFGAALATAEKARTVLVGLGFGFGVAVLGWIGYSLLALLPQPNGGVVFASETLSAISIAGIAALPIALLPLRGLVGHEIFRWNRVVWVVSYAIGLFGFFFVLMPFPFAWTGVPFSIGVWIGLYLLYALLAVGGWLLLARPWEKEKAEGESPNGMPEQA